jgi:hypothetical protein
MRDYPARLIEGVVASSGTAALVGRLQDRRAGGGLVPAGRTALVHDRVAGGGQFGNAANWRARGECALSATGDHHVDGVWRTDIIGVGLSPAAIYRSVDTWGLGGGKTPPVPSRRSPMSVLRDHHVLKAATKSDWGI